jgi:RNA 2',3'-cyclic 3'-phosphodiesterase
MTTMREMTRTFVAIPIPDPLGRQLARWQASLAPEIPGCRWVESAGQPFHITLAFLGDVHSSDLNGLCLAMAAAAEPSVRFELTVEGLGAFPSPARPRVVWAGITADDPGPLMTLREAVVRASTQCGYRPDDDRFHPHITLGRIKSTRDRPSDLTELVRRMQPRSIGSFPVVEVVTYASTLEPGGPSYAPLNRARLKGKKTDASH